MSRPTLEQVRNLNDFQRTYKWLVRFLRVPGGGATSDDLNFRAISATIPKTTVDQIDVEIHGHRTSPPGISRYDQQWTIEFAETINARIRNFYANWREQIWQTNTGLQMPYQELTADVELIALNGKEDQQTWTIKLFGVWLQDADFQQFDSQSEIMRPSVTFIYDYFTDDVSSGANGAFSSTRNVSAVPSSGSPLVQPS